MQRRNVQGELVYTEVNVPFSWEDKPGVCKVSKQASGRSITGHFTTKLPPPPCSLSTTNMVDDLHTPQHSICSSGSKSFRKGSKEPDPFLAAYESCTKTPRNKSCSKNKKDVGFGKRKSMVSFSCKNSCDVGEHNLVRISRFPKCFERE